MDNFNLDDFKRIIERVYREVEVTVAVNGDEITLQVPAEQMAIVIGKRGRNINSLRELVKVYNKIHNSSFSLEIVE